MNLLTALIAIGISNCAIVQTWAFPQKSQQLNATNEGKPNARVPFESVEMNADDIEEIEYQVQLREGETNHLDLSCKSCNVQNDSKTVLPSEQMYLELYKKDFFPFAWIDLKRSYFSNDIFQTGELLTFGEPLTASEGSICRASIASEQKLIGTVHKTDFPHCQVYSNGQLIERADFELLLNQRKVAVTWIDVPNFNEIPNSALLASWSFWLLEPSTKIGKYLGKVVSSEVGPFFLNLPVNIEGDNKMKGNSPFGVAVKLTNETKFQVLVAEGETGPKLSTILCQKTRKAVKLSEYRENKELEVKIVEGGKIPHYQKILQKITKKTLTWKSPPEWIGGGFISTDYDPSLNHFANWIGNTGYICRYRCTDMAECPSYTYQTSNGSTVYQSIDKTIGYHYLEYSPLILPDGRCHVAFNGVAYSTVHFDPLRNLDQLKRSWVPARKATNGTVVVNQLNTEKVYIGQIERKDGTFLIGQVNRTSGRITFSDRESAFEEPVSENVSILTVQV